LCCISAIPHDRSNEFHSQFLDSRMVYSCAYFPRADVPLEEAQLAKLDYICRELNVRPGERRTVSCAAGWNGWKRSITMAVFGSEAVGRSGESANQRHRVDW
jgi:cyclopropane-fatty-acyl-phospholipid synthase